MTQIGIFGFEKEPSGNPGWKQRQNDTFVICSVFTLAASSPGLPDEFVKKIAQNVTQYIFVNF
jgi:hypothetical protein